MRTSLFALPLIAITAGCATPPPLGNWQDSRVSLEDRRKAAAAVTEYPALPAGAKPLGLVTAERCHRNAFDAEPRPETLYEALRQEAYAIGADGMLPPLYEKKDGLARNCWYVLEGYTMAFSLPR